MLRRHKYFGPGNKLDNGEPVDSDDEVAELHDHLYNAAETREDIHAADEKASQDFASLASAHGWLGYAGIRSKQWLEESLGQTLYPWNMPPKRRRIDTKHQGHSLFGGVQGALSRRYQASGGKSRWGSYAAFQRSEEAKNIYREWRNPPQSSQQAGPSGVPRELQDAGNRPQSNPPPTSDLDDTDWDLELANLFGGDADAVDADFPHLSGDRPPTMAAMEVEPEMGMGAGTGFVDTGTTKGGGSGGARTDPSTHTVSIPRPLKAPPCHLTFKRRHVFFTYGYATIGVVKGSDHYLTTPLCCLPVDLLPFYMSSTEFHMIPNFTDARVTSVRAVVKLLGCRTAFDHGASLSGIATNEYIPLLMTAKDLNKNSQGVCGFYDTVATEPMFPTDISLPSVEKYTNRLWNDDACSVTAVPRHLNSYWCLVRPAGSDSSRFPYGNFDLSSQIDLHLINTMIGSVVHDYTYKPKSGYIKNARRQVINPSLMNRNFIVEKGQHVIQLLETSGEWGEYHVSKAGAIEELTFDTNGVFKWEQTLECYQTWNVHSGTNIQLVQPLIYIGIQATPQLSPALSSKSFQNSSVYFSVETECHVTFNPGSEYITGSPVGHYTTAVFHPKEEKKYRRQASVFGRNSQANGDVDDNNVHCNPSVSGTTSRNEFTVEDIDLNDDSEEWVIPGQKQRN
uniref:Putative VP1 n=1 Tax=Phoenicurus auroreus ambidensovirus TaxID=2794456 RepID=A0A8A4XDA8_9VIRU|nr:MAG: putative VP1 [Phoenicurus auroreus ambidensovirus]